MTEISNNTKFEDKGYLQEIFSSIQGEGLYCGTRQLFVRFAGCNLECNYCDTPIARNRCQSFKIEKTPGSGMAEEIANPVNVDLLLEIFNQFGQYHHHSISLTGGEPLLQVNFLRLLLLEPHRHGKKIYMDTNGTLPQNLKEIIELIDILAMDMKLPSTSGLKPYWNEHRQFLETASRKEVFVKIVVDDYTEPGEIIEACKIIKSVNPNIPLFL
ncbi:MAG: 7-carboxy-7-deazaguanine synthase QueE, partial [Vulcanimicrobiota bacterium]